MPIFHRLAPAPPLLCYCFPPRRDPKEGWSQRQSSSVNKPSSETCQATLRYSRTHSLQDAGSEYSEITHPEPSPHSGLSSFLCTLNIYGREWRSGCSPGCPLAQLQQSQAASWRAASLPLLRDCGLHRAPAGSQGHLRAVTDPQQTPKKLLKPNLPSH